MTNIEACLLDYGNTIVEFDRRQIEGLHRRFHEALGSLSELPAIGLDRLARTLDYVCTIPHLGDPPPLRELAPCEQMEVFLREAYGAGLALTPELVARCNQILQDLFVDSIEIDSAAAGWLARSRERIRIGLVSNYPCGKALRSSLERVGIIGHLDPVVISGEVGWVKPHASVFRAALDALGLPPEKVLFVGDRWDADMVGARDAGMRTCHHIGFTSDRELDERYSAYRPDHRITRLEELDGILP
jgi:HAD superfamily hydrolase (TIGR01549 family)